jgi:isoleucyl-tRNA synthetase
VAAVAAAAGGSPNDRVVLDTEVDDSLRREDLAREFISVLQNARKQAGLEVADRIRVSWSCQVAEVRAALDEHSEAIAREVLAVQFGEGPTRETSHSSEHDVGYALDKA